MTRIKQMLAMLAVAIIFGSLAPKAAEACFLGFCAPDYGAMDRWGGANQAPMDLYGQVGESYARNTRSIYAGDSGIQAGLDDGTDWNAVAYREEAKAAVANYRYQQGQAVRNGVIGDLQVANYASQVKFENARRGQYIQAEDARIAVLPVQYGLQTLNQGFWTANNAALTLRTWDRVFSCLGKKYCY